MFTSATLEEVAKDDRPFDLLDFLSIAQRCKVDFLPITWHDGLGPFDAGGSSNLSQSIVDLKTNFAFKRFIKRHNGRASGLRDIASEILTLRSEAIKSHPNFVDLLGVCWEFQQQTNSLEPVLVFPKAPLGNLRTFLHCRPNREVPFVTRLALCIDITRAIAVLHDSENILVFEDGAGKRLAKVIDFAYSSVAGQETAKVYPPRTSPWVMAPEWHHRGFSKEAAKKLDVFSVGMVCLWTLFTSQIRAKFAECQSSSVEQMLQMWKSQKQLVQIAQALIEDCDLGSDLQAGLDRFFTATVADMANKRQSNLGPLIHDLGSEQSVRDLPPSDSTLPQHSHISLNILEYMLQFLWTDCRLRNKIKDVFEDRMNTNCQQCRKSIAYQLAICYLAGFGTRRNEEQGFFWLSVSEKTPVDVSLALAGIESRPVFCNGQFLELWVAGSITPADLTRQYFDHQFILGAELQYRGELVDLEIFAGKEHFLTSTTKILLAKVLQAQDKLVEAGELYGQVITTMQRGERLSHLTPASPMLDLASVLEEQGKWKESEMVLRDLLQLTETMQGVTHPTTILCLTMLSSVVGKQGRLDESEDLDRKTLDRCLSHFGEEHLNSIKAMGNLAVTLSLQGRVEEALALEKAVVAANTRFLGDEHFDTLTSRSNLAKTYQNLEQWEEAETILKNILASRTKVLGAQHRDTISSWADLAGNYFHQERFDEAARMLSELQAPSEAVFGRDHPEHLTIQGNLVEAYRKEGRFQEAHDLCARALGCAVQALGESAPKTMSLMASQGTIYWDSGYIDYAATVFTDLVNLNIEVYGPKSPITLQNTHGLAVCLHANGDQDGARTIMQEVVRLRSEVIGSAHNDTQNSKHVLETWKQSDEVETSRTHKARHLP